MYVPQPLGSMPSSGPLLRSPIPHVRVSTPDITAPVHREEQVYEQGDLTTHVKTETQQQKFGDTTVTKVCREITRDRLSPQPPQLFISPPERPHTPRRHRQVPPAHQQHGFTPVQPDRMSPAPQSYSPVFAPAPQNAYRPVQPDFTPAPQNTYRPVQPARPSPVPQTYSPVFAPAPQNAYKPMQQSRPAPAPQSYSPVFAPAPQNAYRPPGFAPAASPMKHNPDGSFTMTVGMGSLQPSFEPPKQVPQFKVKKVSTAQPKMGTWQPGGSAFQPAPQRARTPSPPPSPPRASVWQPSQPQEPVFRNPRPMPAYVPEPEPTPEPEYYCDPDYNRQVEMESIDLHKYQRGAEFSSEDEYMHEDDAMEMERRRSE